ncbi:MAG: carboxypeptidase regulatory-like domain-containing protein [Planctomycetes bacterium]|nr:carboxypeptidase regulatory-like domain-containing protein [Planctomycetota bacterium]
MMNKRAFVFGSIGVLAAAAIWLAGGGSQEAIHLAGATTGSVARESEPWASVTGRVIDASGSPVASAIVHVDTSTILTGEGATDDDGCYRIELWPVAFDSIARARTARGVELPGLAVSALVSATCAGFCGPQSCEVTIRHRDEQSVPAIRLWRGGFVAGHVVDTAGAQVAAELWCDVESATGDDEVGPDRRVERIPSPVGAGFLAGPFAPGLLTVRAAAHGVGGAERCVAIGEGETSKVTLVLDLPSRLAGRVVDPSGQPVEAITVVCRPDDAVPGDEHGSRPVALAGARGAGHGHRRAAVSREQRMARRQVQVVRTDADGRFAFFCLDRNRSYVVEVPDVPMRDGGATSIATPTREDLLLRIPARCSLGGRVIDSTTGRPVTQCALQSMPQQLANASRLRFPLGLRRAHEPGSESDDDGAFEIDGLFAGTHQVLALAPGYEIGRATVSCAPGATSSACVIRLDPAASLFGHVLDERGKPVTAASLSVQVRPQGNRADRSLEWFGVLRASTDADGHFEIAAIPADVDLVITTRGADSGVDRRDLRLGRSERRCAEIRLQRAGSLTVQLVHPRGWSLPGFPVFVRALDDPESNLEAATDVAGTVRIDDLAPGRYEIRAVHPKENEAVEGVRARIVEVELAPASDRCVELPGPDLAAIGIEVREDGARAALARVGLGPVGDTPDHFEPLSIEIEGGVATALVPPGRYHVSVSIPGARFEADDQLEAGRDSRVSLAVSRRSSSVTRGFGAAVLTRQR